MSNRTYYILLGAVCSALAYLVLRDVRRPPDYTVTRRMLVEAEQRAIFGRDYEFLDDEWDDEDEE